MIHDARKLPDGEQIEADICVVGAGAAGITIATELAGSDIRVCLLESGDMEYDEKTQSLYAGDDTGYPYFPLDDARLTYFGGTTNHWAGWCRPYNADDFEKRDWVPHSGWPIARKEVEPYYERTRPILNLGPNDYTTEFWRDRTGLPEIALDKAKFETEIRQFRTPTRFAEKYRNDLAGAGNIAVYLNANALELVTAGDASRVSRLRVATIDGPRFTVAAKSYVLAMGGIENARILLLSRGSQPAGLGNGHDLVGRFFIEHVRIDDVALIALADPDNLRPGLYFNRFGENGVRFPRGMLSLARDVLRAERLVHVKFNLTPVFKSPGVESAKAIAGSLSRAEFPDRFGQHILNILGDFDSVIDAGYKTVFNDKEGLFGSLGKLVGLRARVVIEQGPNPESRVKLTDKRDILGQQKLEMHWKFTRQDKHSLLRSLRILAAEVGRSGLGRMKINVPDDDSPDSWPESMEGGYHHLGTTRMSDSPREGVVDRNCRVHGIANLFVAGSSVFPSGGGSTTPTITIVALALRLADHLKKEAAL